MFPCLFHILMGCIVVQDDILKHPVFKVGLGSTYRHISTCPPASGSCDVLPNVSSGLSLSSLDSLYLCIDCALGMPVPLCPSDWPCTCINKHTHDNPDCLLL
jgi:hypothetical protein